MPIKDPTIYPVDWPKISAYIRYERAGGRCEFCGVQNLTTVDRGGKLVKIVLTVAHLDQNPRHNDPDNLRALCQKCHLNYDRPFNLAKRASKRGKFSDDTPVQRRKTKAKRKKPKGRNQGGDKIRGAALRDRNA